MPVTVTVSLENGMTVPRQTIPTDWEPLYVDRNRTLTMNEYARHLMMCHPRFAADPCLKFVLLSIKDQYSSMNQVNYWLKQHEEMQDRTISEYRNVLQETNNQHAMKHLNNSIQSFTSSVTGSSSYWWKQSYELRCLVDFMLTHKQTQPLWFHTGSCAEFFWRPLHKVLMNYFELNGLPAYANACRLKASGEDVPPEIKRAVHKALLSCPQAVNKFFVNRTNSWMRNVMETCAGVTDWWVRYEFAKSRGQIHFHSILWAKAQAELIHSLMNPLQESSSKEESQRILKECAQNINKLLTETLGAPLEAMHPAGRKRTCPEDQENDTSWYKQRVKIDVGSSQYRFWVKGEDWEDGNIGNVEFWTRPEGHLKPRHPNVPLQRGALGFRYPHEENDAVPFGLSTQEEFDQMSFNTATSSNASPDFFDHASLSSLSWKCGTSPKNLRPDQGSGLSFDQLNGLSQHQGGSVAAGSIRSSQDTDQLKYSFVMDLDEIMPTSNISDRDVNVNSFISFFILFLMRGARSARSSVIPHLPITLTDFFLIFFLLFFSFFSLRTEARTKVSLQ